MISHRIFPLVTFSLPLVAALAGCNTAATSAPAINPNTQAISGRWNFVGTPVSLAAGLVESSGNVSGTATVYGCSSAPQQTLLTGSVSGTGELTLETQPLAGGAFLKVHGQLSADGKTTSSANLVSSGSGCMISSAVAIKGQVYSPATGSYSGAFTGSDGVSIPVTAILSQSTDPGAGGGYALSGSVSFPGSPCLNGDDSATIMSADSTVTGSTLQATYLTPSQPQVTITATGTADASAANLTISRWTISGGPCNSYTGTGELTD